MAVEAVWMCSVMQHQVEAYYLREHAGKREVLSFQEDIDALIDSLLAGPAPRNLAELHCLERSTLPSGFPDHEFLVGVDRNRGVGVLGFMDSAGNVVTLGSPEGGGEVSYFIDGNSTEFPISAEIPIDLVRSAAKEFLLSSGGRPTCVQWQTPEQGL